MVDDPHLNSIQQSPAIKAINYDRQIPIVHSSDYSVETLNGEPVLIGKGSAGTLILARHNDTGKFVVIKLLSTNTMKLCLEFTLQAKAHQVLGRHAPDVVGFLQVKKSSSLNKGCPEGQMRYLPVMEFCPLVPDSKVSMTLLQAAFCHLGGTRMLSKKEWANIFLTLIDKVNNLQSNDIYHLDLKPDNIMLCFDGDEPYPVIIDYGIAQTVDRHRKRSVIIKTTLNPEMLPHCAPELFQQNYPLPTTDLYSLAFVMICINTRVLKSEALHKSLINFRESSPASRMDYEEFKSLIESVLNY